LSLLFSQLLEVLTQNQYNNTDNMKKNYTDLRNIFGIGAIHLEIKVNILIKSSKKLLVI